MCDGLSDGGLLGDDQHATVRIWNTAKTATTTYLGRHHELIAAIARGMIRALKIELRRVNVPNRRWLFNLCVVAEAERLGFGL